VKRIALLLAALVAAGTAVIAAATAFVPADMIRDAVVSEIKAATGLTLRLHGPVSVSMFPAPTIVFSDVALAGGETSDGAASDGAVSDRTLGAPEATLTAGSLTVSLRLMPMLAQRITIADMALARPSG